MSGLEHKSDLRPGPQDARSVTAAWPVEDGGKKAIQSTQQDARDLQELGGTTVPRELRRWVFSRTSVFPRPPDSPCLGQDPDCKPPSHTDAARAHGPLQDH